MPSTVLRALGKTVEGGIEADACRRIGLYAGV
jgi:hypothetical protein